MEDLIQQLWDEHSTFIDDNASSFEAVAGSVVMKRSDFFKMMYGVVEKEVGSRLLKMMSENPVKFVQYAMVVIGRDLQKSNAANSTVSFDATLEDGKRFNIKMVVEINEVDGE